MAAVVQPVHSATPCRERKRVLDERKQRMYDDWLRVVCFGGSRRPRLLAYSIPFASWRRFQRGEELVGVNGGKWQA